MTTPRAPDEFELYDLAVIVERIEGHCTCDMRVGDRVDVRGGKLAIGDARGFCLYALQAAIPLLPAKQRPGHPADWMETDVARHVPRSGVPADHADRAHRPARAPSRRRQRGPLGPPGRAGRPGRLTQRAGRAASAGRALERVRTEA